jgi:hypothetical protein
MRTRGRIYLTPIRAETLRLNVNSTSLCSVGTWEIEYEFDVATRSPFCE